MVNFERFRFGIWQRAISPGIRNQKSESLFGVLAAGTERERLVELEREEHPVLALPAICHEDLHYGGHEGLPAQGMMRYNLRDPNLVGSPV